jgi:hypothetical protein
MVSWNGTPRAHAILRNEWKCEAFPPFSAPFNTGAIALQGSRRVSERGMGNSIVGAELKAQELVKKPRRKRRKPESPAAKIIRAFRLSNPTRLLLVGRLSQRWKTVRWRRHVWEFLRNVRECTEKTKRFRFRC